MSRHAMKRPAKAKPIPTLVEVQHKTDNAPENGQDQDECVPDQSAYHNMRSKPASYKGNFRFHRRAPTIISKMCSKPISYKGNIGLHWRVPTIISKQMYQKHLKQSPILNEITSRYQNMMDEGVMRLLCQSIIIDYAIKLPIFALTLNQNHPAVKDILQVVDELHETYDYENLLEVLDKMPKGKSWGAVHYIRAKVLFRNNKLKSIDADRVFVELYKASQLNILEAILDLAVVSETGVLWGVDINSECAQNIPIQWNSGKIDDIPNLQVSRELYRKAADLGSHFAQFALIRLDREDSINEYDNLARLDSLARNVELKCSDHRILIPGSETKLWSEILLYLADFYLANTLFLPACDMAYLWTKVVYNTTASNEAAALLKEYRARLPHDERIRVDKVSHNLGEVSHNVDFSLWNTAIPTPETYYEKYLAKVTRCTVSSVQSQTPPAEAIQKDKHTEPEVTAVIPAEAGILKPHENTIDSPQAYKYLSDIKDFDKNKISLELCGLVPREGNFQHIKILYDGKNPDKKEPRNYQKIHKSERELLYCLACVSQDKDHKMEWITKVLSGENLRDTASHLNSMLKAMFPILKGKSQMIDRSGKLLNVKISFKDAVHARNREKCKTCKQNPEKLR